MRWKTELCGYLAAFHISTASILHLFFGTHIITAFMLGLHPFFPGYWLLMNKPPILWPGLVPTLACLLTFSVSTWRIARIVDEQLGDLFFEDRWIDKRK